MKLKSLTILFLFSIVFLNLNVKAQTFDWVKGINGIIAFDVFVDHSGNVYSTGSLIDTATFDNIVLMPALTNPIIEDIYFAKFNRLGQVIWVRHVSGQNGNGEGRRILTDNSGNVYISGSFTGQIKFGSTTITSLGDRDAYLAKYSSQGTFQWVRSGGGAGLDFVNGMNLDSRGNIYCTGEGFGILQFGNNIVPGENIHGFIVRYNPQGQLVRGISVPETTASDVVIHATGEIYVTGSDFYGTNQGYVAKYNASGTRIWTFRLGDQLGSEYTGSFALYLELDGAGNVFASGNTASIGIFLLKLNKLGQLQFVKEPGGGVVSGMSLDENDNIYLNVNQTFFVFNEIALENDEHNLVAKYTERGEFVWLKGYEALSTTGIVVSNTDKVYISAMIDSGTFNYDGIIVINDSDNFGSIIGEIIQPKNSIVSFVLVNADTDTDIRTINVNDTIILSELPTTHLSIRANTYPYVVGSVKLVFDAITRVENVSPYALFADQEGDYNPGFIKTGKHFLSALPYSGFNASGIAGIGSMINFYVLNSSISSKQAYEIFKSDAGSIDVKFIPYPNPSSGVFNLTFEPASKTSLKVEIFDVNGQFIQKLFEGESEEHVHLVWVPGNATGGIYLCKYSYGNQIKTSKLLFKE